MDFDKNTQKALEQYKLNKKKQEAEQEALAKAMAEIYKNMKKDSGNESDSDNDDNDDNDSIIDSDEERINSAVILEKSKEIKQKDEYYQRLTTEEEYQRKFYEDAEKVLNDTKKEDNKKPRKPIKKPIIIEEEDLEPKKVINQKPIIKIDEVCMPEPVITEIEQPKPILKADEKLKNKVKKIREERALAKQKQEQPKLNNPDTDASIITYKTKTPEQMTNDELIDEVYTQKQSKEFINKENIELKKKLKEMEKQMADFEKYKMFYLKNNGTDTFQTQNDILKTFIKNTYTITNIIKDRYKPLQIFNKFIEYRNSLTLETKMTKADMDIRRFCQKLADLGLERITSNGTNYFIGLKLNE